MALFSQMAQMVDAGVTILFAGLVYRLLENHQKLVRDDLHHIRDSLAILEERSARSARTAPLDSQPPAPVQ